MIVFSVVGTGFVAVWLFLGDCCWGTKLNIDLWDKEHRCLDASDVVLLTGLWFMEDRSLRDADLFTRRE